MTFTEPYYLALIVLLAPILWLGVRRRNTVGHSRVGMHAHLSSRSVMRHMSTILLCLLWISACAAPARPVPPQVAHETNYSNARHRRTGGHLRVDAGAD